MGDKGVFLFFKPCRRSAARPANSRAPHFCRGGHASALLQLAALRGATRHDETRRDSGGSPQCISLGKGETLRGKE